ncbi:replication-relaxation family protein [Streptomyces sioyaensis]|uniref:replication-relaxation family protein n=1 Tax=Streptomyces sioyaensis TaxID=67364 RepID=UPI0033EEC7B9
MSGKKRLYPYGSTASLRQDVLCVLGVLKVATADQIRRLTRPEAKNNKSHRNAALDLQRHGLTLSEGNASNGHKLWGLTPSGLESAASHLGRSMEEMGGIARGAARHGATHAMAVNETVLALMRPGRHAQYIHLGAVGDLAIWKPSSAQPAATGIGSLSSWATEVGLPVSGSWSKPGAGSPRADAVLQALEVGLPLLLVEVDCGTETTAVIAAKFDKYRRFFRRKVQDTDGRDIPLWQTRWGTTGQEEYQGHPPVALVFMGVGPRGLRQRMEAVCRLSRGYWSGSMHRTNCGALHYDYRDAIPILATTLERLQTYGPLGPAWWRYGHTEWEPIHRALGNPAGITVGSGGRWEEHSEAGVGRMPASAAVPVGD